MADKGFAGARPHQRWKEQMQVEMVTPPHQTSQRERWPKALRRWLASIRQIIETVNDKLLNTFRLARERPQDLTGLQARLAHGLRNEMSIFLKWLHRLIQCSRLFLIRDEKYLCLVEPGERGSMLSSQFIVELNLVAQPVGLATKVSLHNFCLWVNLHLGRAPLAEARFA